MTTGAPRRTMTVQRALKSLSTTQITVQRALASTRELDTRFQASQQRAIDSMRSCLEMLRTGEGPPPEKLRQVRSEQRSTFLLADKKLSLISETYDVVDRQIGKLEVELEKVHADLGQGADIVPLLLEEPELQYCVCGQGSYGDMVCCDNPMCATEWFHFDCVGLRVTPEVSEEIDVVWKRNWKGKKASSAGGERQACSRPPHA